MHEEAIFSEALEKRSKARRWQHSSARATTRTTTGPSSWGFSRRSVRRWPAYAHSHDVIHRDLKPSNIMVGEFGEVQIMDWGLAKILTEEVIADEIESCDRDTVDLTRQNAEGDTPQDRGQETRPGCVLGTPAYMPPEQALGEVDRLNERCDVFGLGAILCEILTGNPPYVGADSQQVFRQASRGMLDDCFAQLSQCEAKPELVRLAKDSEVARQAEGEKSKQLEQQLRTETVTRLVAQSVSLREQWPIRSVLLAIEAVATTRRHDGTIMPVAHETLLNAAPLVAGKPLVGHEAPVAAMAISPDGRWLVTGSGDDTVRIWDLRAAEPSSSAVVLRGHQDDVKDVAISPDGRWLVTGSTDKTARMWDLDAEHPGVSPRVFRGHEAGVASVAISSDGHWLATGSQDGTVRLWDLTTEGFDDVPDRTFTSFSQAGMEGATSRLYGGIHWSFDNEDAFRHGRDLAIYMNDNFLRPIPEPSSAALACIGLVLLLASRRKSRSSSPITRACPLPFGCTLQGSRRM